MKEENKKYFLLFVFLFLIALAIIFKKAVFSYDTNIAHPFLAEKSITLFNNQKSGYQLSSEQAGWLIRGAEEEDTAPRWVNHFYNPNTGFGLPGFNPANIWVKNSLAQSTYLMGDQTWQTAINAYNNGDKKRAFIALGHVLHLIEDMAVPAHTRIDSHPKGDPYESWVKLNIGQKLNLNTPVVFSNLNDYFNSLANYSNKYFLSKDTIISKNFINKNLLEKRKDGVNFQCLEETVEGNKVCLAIYKKSKFGKEEYLLDFSENISVHSDYFSLLAPKAISYGAGVIDLFFKQAEIEKNKKPTLFSKFKKTFSTISGVLISSFSNLFGTYQAVVTDYSNKLGVGNNSGNSGPAQTLGQVLSAFEQAGSAEKIFKPQPSKAENENEKANEKINQAPSTADFVADKNIPLGEEQNSPNLVSPGEQNIFNPPLAVEQSPAEPSQPIIFQPTGSGSASISAAGDTAPPETSITSAPSQIISSSSAAFLFTASENNSTFDCNLNGLDWQVCVSPHNLYSLTDRSHIFKVRARDLSNNFDQTPAEHSWTVDTIAPQVTIVSGPPDISSSTTADFQFTSSESHITYQCQLDANPTEACSASTSAASLIEGRHSLEVRGLDRAGNTGSSTVKTWLVDLTAPISIVDSLNSAYSATGFNVSWSGGDADATGATTTVSGLADFDVQYKIDAVSWQDWINATTSTSTIFNLPLTGGQTVSFRARARDLAGNLGAWSNEAETQISSNSADHLVISEAQISGASADDEFIELYNPTDSNINLSPYSVQYRGSNSLNFYKKNFISDSFVGPKAYYLIAPSQYGGSVSPDMAYSSFNLSGSGGTIFLVDNHDLLTGNSATSTAVVDRLAYGSGAYLFPEGSAYSTVPSAGQSLERKAVATSTALTMTAGGVHENQGNGYDSNDNSADFILKNVSIPQSASNSLEPKPEVSLGLKHLWHFDECEGSSLNNSVGVDNLPQNATRIVGKWQCAINQSWQAQYNIEKTFAEPLPAGELTYVFYLRSNDWSNAARNHFYLKSADGSVMAGVRPSMYTKNLYFNGLATTTIPAMPNNNDWHMITAVYGQNGLVYYVDGVRQAFFSGDYSIDEPITSLEIKGENWTIDIEEMAIWSRALGSDEVADIYNSQAPLEPYYPPAAPLSAERIHWWHFDEGAGATAADSVGSMSLSPIVAWKDGKSGSGIEHTWTRGYEINQDVAPEISSKDLSIDFWWQNSSFPNEGRVSLELQNSAGVKVFGLKPSIYSGRYYFDGSDIAIGNIIPQDSNWHHLTLVYDSYNFYLYFYVDGVEKIKTPKVWFGRPITKLVIRGENWTYKLDELAIWRGALTAEQVLNIYQGE